MNIQLQAGFAVQAMALSGVREQLAAIQANPLPASAPVSEQAKVILSLSSAAQSLLVGAP